MNFPLTSQEPLPTFRHNVGVVIFNDEGKVWAGERMRIKDAWQLPQGGIEEGDTVVATAFKEMWEETGIKPEHVDLIGESKCWYNYEFQRHNYRDKHFGQTQKYVAFKFKAEDSVINLKASHHQEFRNWEWVSPEWLVKNTAEFRTEIYNQVFEEFKATF